MFDGIASLPNETLGKVTFEWNETVQIDRYMLEEDGGEAFAQYIDGIQQLVPNFPDAPKGWRWELANNVTLIELAFTYAPRLQVALRWRLVPIPEHVIQAEPASDVEAEEVMSS